MLSPPSLSQCPLLFGSFIKMSSNQLFLIPVFFCSRFHVAFQSIVIRAWFSHPFLYFLNFSNRSAWFVNFVQLQEECACLLSTANNKQGTEQSFWSHVGTDSWGMDKLHLSLWLAEKFTGNLKGLEKSCLLTDFLFKGEEKGKAQTEKHRG